MFALWAWHFLSTAPQVNVYQHLMKVEDLHNLQDIILMLKFHKIPLFVTCCCFLVGPRGSEKTCWPILSECIFTIYNINFYAICHILSFNYCRFCPGTVLVHPVMRQIFAYTMGLKSKPDLALTMQYVGHKLCNENGAI